MAVVRRPCMRAAPLVLLLSACLAGLTAPAATARDRKPAVPCDAALPLLASQGFAVCPERRVRLHAPYRWPKGPVFVTAGVRQPVRPKLPAQINPAQHAQTTR